MDASGKKILIVKLSSLGDIIHSLPLLRSLRVSFPGAHIAWVVEEKCKDALYGNTDLDELIVVRTKHWRRNRDRQSLGELRDVLRRLRARRFDIAFDFQGLIKSGAIACLSGARERIGFHPKDCREWANVLFTNRKAPYFGKNGHVIDKNLALLALAGARSIVKEFPLKVPESAEAYIAAYLRDNPGLTAAPVAAVNPGAGFKTKRWDLDRFAQTADRIAVEMGMNILLTWGPGEEEHIRHIASRMQQRRWIAPPTDIQQTIALFRQVSLFVGCDTGPLHICAALGVPTVSIFGPTDPVRNGPYGPNHEIVCKPIPCAFCYKRSCPYHNECMTGVTVEDVMQAVRKCAAVHASKSPAS